MLRDHVIEEVGGRLRKSGFKRKGTTWRREGEHGIEVFNLQGSRFGSGAFFLNVGLYLGGDPGLLEPTASQCSFRSRIEHENRTGEEVFEEVRLYFERLAQHLDELSRTRTVDEEPVRVRHTSFGVGTVVEDHGGTAKVAFEDGTTRLLKKTHLEVLPGPT